jgi:hypothetical protein
MPFTRRMAREALPKIALEDARVLTNMLTQMVKNEHAVTTPVSNTTAGNVTYTADDLLSGLIVRDPNGLARTDTLPTAALLIAALQPDVEVGDIFRAAIVNGADAAEAITLGAGTGGTFPAAQTAASRVIPQNAGRELIIQITGVTAGAEAYTAYLI